MKDFEFVQEVPFQTIEEALVKSKKQNRKICKILSSEKKKNRRTREKYAEEMRLLEEKCAVSSFERDGLRMTLPNVTRKLRLEIRTSFENDMKTLQRSKKNTAEIHALKLKLQKVRAEKNETIKSTVLFMKSMREKRDAEEAENTRRMAEMNSGLARFSLGTFGTQNGPDGEEEEEDISG